jgi:hypothetical protein
MASLFLSGEGDPPVADETDRNLHTVPAGVLDRLLGNRGPNGELMENGKPAQVADLPDDDEDD